MAVLISITKSHYAAIYKQDFVCLHCNNIAYPTHIIRQSKYRRSISMLSATKSTHYCAKYTDLSNKTRNVKHSVVLSTEERKEIEEKIVEELYRIFTHKAG